MDNGAMENFFGRLKVEVFYEQQFESVENFIQALDGYIHYYNNERISLKLKGMSPVQYRTHSQVNIKLLSKLWVSLHTRRLHPTGYTRWARFRIISWARSPALSSIKALTLPMALRKTA